MAYALPITKMLLLFLVLQACSTEGNKLNEPANDSSSQTRLTITGSSTLAPMVAEMAKLFEKSHPNIRVDVQTGGSSRGIADVKQVSADLGMVSRRLYAEETQIVPYLIARDGVTMIVHQKNPLSDISQQQIRDIYLSKSPHWPDNVLPGKNITRISKAEGRSTLEVFLGFLGVKNSQIQADIIIGDNEQAVKLVAGNPLAIAYVSTSTAEYDVQLGIPIKALSIDSIQPSQQNIAQGVFPLNRELNLISNHHPTPLAQRFIEFAQSDAVKPIIAEFRFVPAS